MKKIKLLHEKFTLVDNDDFEYLNQFHWSLNGRGAVARHSKEKTILMHREVMKAKKGESVDHINHKTFDNRKSNLRICTFAQNMYNRLKRKDNKSGYRGVSWSKQKNKWRVCLTKDGHQYHGGFFNNLETARQSHRKMAKKLYGEFAGVGR